LTRLEKRDSKAYIRPDLALKIPSKNPLKTKGFDGTKTDSIGLSED
jgi:hypothetical protein